MHQLTCFAILPSNRAGGKETQLVRDPRYGLIEQPFECSLTNKCDAQQSNLGPAVDFDAVYQEIIEAAISQVNQQATGRVHIACKRSVEAKEPGSILRRLIEDICTAEITVTDITIPNPNVYLELGIRMAVKDPLNIIIHHQGVVLPFDLYDYRCIEYDPGLRGAGKAREAIAMYIQNNLETLCRPKSDVSSGFFTLLIESFTRQQANLRLINKLEEAPRLVVDLAKMTLQNGADQGLKNDVSDFLRSLAETLEADTKRRRQAIECYQFYSQLPDLSSRQLKRAYEKLAELCGEDPQYQDQAKEYRTRLKELEQ